MRIPEFILDCHHTYGVPGTSLAVASTPPLPFGEVVVALTKDGLMACAIGAMGALMGKSF